VLHLVFTEWLQTSEWLKPVLYLSFLDTYSTVRAADALQTDLRADPVPWKSLKAAEDCQGSQNIVYHRAGHESPAFIFY